MKYTLAFVWGVLVASGIWAASALALAEDVRRGIVSLTVMLIMGAIGGGIWLALGE